MVYYFIFPPLKNSPLSPILYVQLSNRHPHLSVMNAPQIQLFQNGGHSAYSIMFVEWLHESSNTHTKFYPCRRHEPRKERASCKNQPLQQQISAYRGDIIDLIVSYAHLNFNENSKQIIKIVEIRKRRNEWLKKSLDLEKIILPN